jgi:uncharacterized membrane protein YoaK (UPF0700 family)
MRSVRTRDALLVALTVSTGAVDAVSWLGLGKVFSAFMTGNIAFLGFGAAGAAGISLPQTAVSLVAFATGAVVGRLIAGPDAATGAWPRRVTRALGLSTIAQVAFLVVWIAVDGRPSTGTAHGLIAMSALAMGVQTAAIASLGVRAIYTTAATATLTLLMGDLSSWSQSGGERLRLASVLCGLFAGALAGGLLFLHARTWAPLLPLALSAGVVAVALLRFPHDAVDRQPLSTSREPLSST